MGLTGLSQFQKIEFGRKEFIIALKDRIRMDDRRIIEDRRKQSTPFISRHKQAYNFRRPKKDYQERSGQGEAYFCRSLWPAPVHNTFASFDSEHTGCLFDPWIGKSERCNRTQSYYGVIFGTWQCYFFLRKIFIHFSSDLHLLRIQPFLHHKNLLGTGNNTLSWRCFL